MGYMHDVDDTVNYMTKCTFTKCTFTLGDLQNAMQCNVDCNKNNVYLNTIVKFNTTRQHEPLHKKQRDQQLANSIFH